MSFHYEILTQLSKYKNKKIGFERANKADVFFGKPNISCSRDNFNAIK